MDAVRRHSGSQLAQERGGRNELAETIERAGRKDVAAGRLDHDLQQRFDAGSADRVIAIV
jgi:hypothetical protein